MKIVNHRLAGLFLFSSVVLVGMIIHWFGPGLIITEHPLPPPPTETSQGFTVVTNIEKTSYHVALIPLLALGIAGLVLAIIPKRG